MATPLPGLRPICYQNKETLNSIATRSSKKNNTHSAIHNPALLLLKMNKTQPHPVHEEAQSHPPSKSHTDLHQHHSKRATKVNRNANSNAIAALLRLVVATPPTPMMIR